MNEVHPETATNSSTNDLSVFVSVNGTKAKPASLSVNENTLQLQSQDETISLTPDKYDIVMLSPKGHYYDFIVKNLHNDNDALKILTTNPKFSYRILSIIIRLIVILPLVALFFSLISSTAEKYSSTTNSYSLILLSTICVVFLLPLANAISRGIVGYLGKTENSALVAQTIYSAGFKNILNSELLKKYDPENTQKIIQRWRRMFYGSLWFTLVITLLLPSILISMLVSVLVQALGVELEGLINVALFLSTMTIAGYIIYTPSKYLWFKFLKVFQTRRYLSNPDTHPSFPLEVTDVGLAGVGKWRVIIPFVCLIILSIAGVISNIVQTQAAENKAKDYTNHIKLSAQEMSYSQIADLVCDDSFMQVDDISEIFSSFNSFGETSAKNLSYGVYAKFTSNDPVAYYYEGIDINQNIESDSSTFKLLLEEDEDTYCISWIQRQSYRKGVKINQSEVGDFPIKMKENAPGQLKYINNN